MEIREKLYKFLDCFKFEKTVDEQISKRSVELSDVVVGNTSICSIGKNGHLLTYRGYDITDIAENCEFEEVIYLLIYGHLPNEDELLNYKVELKNFRFLPEALIEILEKLPIDTHPMDVLRISISWLGIISPENREYDIIKTKNNISNLIVSTIIILLYWYQFATYKTRIDFSSDEDSLAGYFLHLFLGKKANKTWVKTMNISLILYAEHELNASTFTARVIAGTGSDMYSSITGAIGALKGFKHGGANEDSLKVQQCYLTPLEAEVDIKKRILKGDTIPGFGHPLYTKADPRNGIIKNSARNFSQHIDNMNLYNIAEKIESVMLSEKKIFANLDWFSTIIYCHMGIPVNMFTAIFALSRISGWGAHIIEQRESGKIIRPKSHYNGCEKQTFLNLYER